MEKWKKRSIELTTAIALGSRDEEVSVVPYYPQKTRVSGAEEKFFPRSVPEKHGISSKRIYSLLCELEAEPRSNVHSLMILAGGEVIAECSRDGYGVSVAHLSHSMSKTVTGMAIGLLVDDGVLELDTPIVKLLPEYEYKDKRFTSITLQHLLAMTAGVSFSEAGAVTETDWTASFFASALKFNPGAKFNYNSMNSYVLARIADKYSDKGFSRLIEDRLFGPLGIKNYFWEKSPEGTEKGGWGLYMSAESWAKLGYMMLSGGKFFGRRILSEEWVKLATMTHALSPSAEGDFNYGYQLWVGRGSDEVLFNGMLGQNVWICPKNGIVAVVFSGNNELFQNSPTLELIRRHLGYEISDELYDKDIKVLHERETQFFDSRRWVRPLEKKRGLLTWLGVRPKTPFDERFSDILGTYVFADNREGMLPLFVRAMQNNLASRLERVSFERVAESLYMSFRESGVDYRIEIGLYGYKTSILDFRGEKYIVRAMGESVKNSDKSVEYRIELLFPELPNTRMITVYKQNRDSLSLTLSELPNNRIVDTLIDSALATSGVLGFALDLLERRFGVGFLQKKIERTFAPELIAADESREEWEKIIEEENARLSVESGTVRFIRAVVNRFFKVDDEEEEKQEKPEKAERGSWAQGLLGRLFGRSKAVSADVESGEDNEAGESTLEEPTLEETAPEDSNGGQSAPEEGREVSLDTESVTSDESAGE